jgi:Asp-tRNA(Asn)/Glu-tRNA(Gln) amidotransferase A subunit family amidase
MKGLPVGVQLVGNKWEDEKVIAMMRVLDDALGARGFGAGSSLTK